MTDFHQPADDAPAEVGRSDGASARFEQLAVDFEVLATIHRDAAERFRAAREVVRPGFRSHPER